ncbi:MAG: hypothetical protein Q4G05_05855 [Clostridia bacterium]|nr:hypothetical protein [Clostridia bacterium]
MDNLKNCRELMSKEETERFRELSKKTTMLIGKDGETFVIFNLTDDEKREYEVLNEKARKVNIAKRVLNYLNAKGLGDLPDKTKDCIMEEVFECNMLSIKEKGNIFKKLYAV